MFCTHCYCSLPDCKSRDYTYKACLEYLEKHELKVSMPPFVTAVDMPDDTSTKDICAPTDNTEQSGYSEEGLHGRGLLHYKKWWERSEADIFVNGNILTGIPIFTDKNTLRVVNSAYSYFIPLEKIDYIRTTDGLEACCYSNTDASDETQK